MPLGLLILLLAQAPGAAADPLPASLERAKALAAEGRRAGEAGDARAAVRAFSAALTITPDPAILDARGIAWEALGQFEAAVGDFSQALRIQPQFGDAYAHRGVAEDELGRYDAAVADYSRALTLSGPSAEIYFNRGAAFEHRRLYDRALADYAAALRLDPELAPAMKGAQRLGARSR